MNAHSTSDSCRDGQIPLALHHLGTEGQPGSGEWALRCPPSARWEFRSLVLCGPLLPARWGSLVRGVQSHKGGARTKARVPRGYVLGGAVCPETYHSSRGQAEAQGRRQRGHVGHLSCSLSPWAASYLDPCPSRPQAEGRPWRSPDRYTASLRYARPGDQGTEGLVTGLPSPPCCLRGPPQLRLGLGRNWSSPSGDTGHSWKVQEINLQASGLASPVQGMHGSRGSSAFFPRQASARGD